MSTPGTMAAGSGAPTRDPFQGNEAVLAWAHDLAPYGLFTTDTSLVIRSWNQWLVAHSGRTAESVIGRPLLEIYPEVAARQLDERFMRALQGEISVLSTALHRHLLPFDVVNPVFGVPHMMQTARIAPLTMAGRVVGTITIIEDVTQRECQAAILHRQQEHDRLLSHALELVLKSDRPDDIASELFPRLATPLKLEVFFNYLLSPDGRELRLQGAGGVAPDVHRALATLQLGEGFCGQVALRRRPLIAAEVQTIPGELAASSRRLGLRSYAGFPLVVGDRLLGTLAFGSYDRDTMAPDEIEFLGNIAGYVAIALDRHRREQELRTAEQRLRVHAEELESKVAERTRKLHETIEQVETFSYTVAHDLRAPIRSLTGCSRILLDEHTAAMPEEAQDLVRRLYRAGHRLDALTRDLLQFSRISRADVQLTPLDLTELVQELVAMTPTLQDGILTIEPPLGTVLAQRTFLQQCLSNLFDNALKFRHPQRVPCLIVRAEARPPLSPPKPGERAVGRRRIWVEDNGIGIPAEAFQKIFGIFERIPGPAPIEGTGIGLAIVARATEQMGGTCGVESTLGEGSRFWLEFPES